MRRPFHVLRPTTWPRWFWYLLMTIWCAVTSAGFGWLAAAIGEYPFWQIAVATFLISVTWHIGGMIRYDYERTRKDAS